MKRFIQGEYRGQSTLLPKKLDDYVGDTNPAHVVDLPVDELYLTNLVLKAPSQPLLAGMLTTPTILLKIYIYALS